jgi:hypothetical protein
MFNERFRSVLVTSDEQFACLVRYVVLNPVNAGLCRDPMLWPWSSHARMTAGEESPLVAVRRVEELLAPWGERRGSRYASLVSDGGPFGPWGEAVQPRPPRPAVKELLASMPRDDAMRAARHRHGYRLVEIAAAAGISATTVSRRTRT